MAKKEVISRADNMREECDRAYEKMNEPLRATLKWILKWQSDETCHTLMGRWELGKQVTDVYKDMTQNGEKVYGKAPIKLLSVFIHEDPSVLHTARRLYDLYPDKKDVEAICDMRMLDGYTPVAYSHVRQLLSIENAQKRQEALNLALMNCWTSAELGQYVQKLKGGKTTNNPNGRAAIPKDAEAVIAQQIAFADDFENRNLRVWKDPRHSLSAQVDKLKPEEYTEELAERLGEVAKRLRQLADEAVARAEEAERKYREISAALKDLAKLKSVAELVLSEEDGDEHLPPNPRGNRPVGRRAKVMG